jgi:short-chain fatty acids transporter
MLSIKKAIIDINHFLSRIIPDSFTIAILLTIIVFISALLGEIFYSNEGFFAAIMNCISAWGNGFFVLLEFAMQMCLIILSGYIIAVSRPVKRFLESLIRFPKTSAGLTMLVASISMIGCYINWGFGLIIGAVLVKTAYSIRREINYIFLVAVAYLGMGTTWHGGLSGSVPLLLATENHFLSGKIGVIPVGETIFATYNIVLMLVIFIVMLLLVYLMYTPPQEEVHIKSDTGGEDISDQKDSDHRGLENSYILNLVLFSLVLFYNIYDIFNGRFSLSLNRINMIFLGLGFLLHRSPVKFVDAATRGASLLIGVIVQFPLYAGIYGIIKGTSILSIITNLFVSLSSTKTLPFVIFIYSGILNYFVPSGGSKWAIEAPYIIDVAMKLNVPISRVAMCYAYGDMWTNLVQPFWAIPLLSAAGIEFKRILGYEIVFALVYGLIVSIATFLI